MDEKYYYIVKNNDIIRVIDTKELPHSDEVKLLDGNLKESVISNKDLLHVNDVIKYKIGSYHANQVIIETGPTAPNNSYERGTLDEDGFYYVELSSAGAKGANLDRFVGTWQIKDKNDKVIDEIILYRQNIPGGPPGNYTGSTSSEGVVLDENNISQVYNWERKRIYDDGFSGVWKGNYVYLNHTVYLSLLEFGYYEEATRNYNKVTWFEPDDDYGILMFKEDIESEENDKWKLFAYRSDDTIEDENFKYSFTPGGFSLSNYAKDYNTTDAKGEDGKFLNQVIKTEKGNISFKVGTANQLPANQNINGGGSEILGVFLEGGKYDVYFNNFGGRGGSFIYDYYGRIKYNELQPEHGNLKITYLGLKESLIYNIDVTHDGNIDSISYPNNYLPAGTIITLKVKSKKDYEVDLEKSTITTFEEIDGNLTERENIPFNEFIAKAIKDNVLQDIQTTITEWDYYNIQDIVFAMPLYSVKINLVSKRIKYKVRIETDENIKGYEINIKNPETKEIESESGKLVEITIEYISGDYKIDENVFIYYLAFNPDDKKVAFGKIGKDYKQTISFEMPSRNIIIRVVCDLLLTLTIQTDTRQELEDEIRQDDREIKTVLLRYFTEAGTISESREITFFPDISKVKPGTIFDLYIEFSDPKMHLDKLEIWMQLPSAIIEEAGDFWKSVHDVSPTLEYRESQKVPAPIQVVPRDISDNDHIYDRQVNPIEWWQHIRFKMPWQSVILNLKWTERLFSLQINFMELFFNKILFFNNEWNQRDSIQPRKLYPYAISRNKVDIEMTAVSEYIEIIHPKEGTSMDQLTPPDASYVLLGNVAKKKDYYKEIPRAIINEYKNKLIVKTDQNVYELTSPPIRDIIGEEFYLYSLHNILYFENFRMPKRDVFFFLNIKYLDDKIILISTGYQTGSMVLAPGSYTVYIGGGKGGDGGAGGSGGDGLFCISGDSLILTKDGLKRIDQLKEGDIIINHKNEEDRIVNVMIETRNETFKLKIDGNEIRITSDHPILLDNEWWAIEPSKAYIFGCKNILENKKHNIKCNIIRESLTVYNLELEGEDHTYIANNLVLHNGSGSDFGNWFQNIKNAIKEAQAALLGEWGAGAYFDLEISKFTNLTYFTGNAGIDGGKGSSGQDGGLLCISGDSLVLTKNGLRRIDSLKVNDVIVNHENKEDKIKNVIKAIRNDAIKLKIDNKRIIITPDHPILLDNEWYAFNPEIAHIENCKPLLKNKNHKIKYNYLKKSIKVYNLELESDTHTYIANSIVLHNGSGSGGAGGSGGSGGGASYFMLDNPAQLCINVKTGKRYEYIEDTKVGFKGAYVCGGNGGRGEDGKDGGGGLWCISGDSLILTKNGLKRIDSLNEGDFVLNKDYNEESIIKLIKNRRNDAYNLKIDEKEIIITSDHPIYLDNKWWAIDPKVAHIENCKPLLKNRKHKITYKPVGILIPVYNLELSGPTNTYIANDIVLHNSSGGSGGKGGAGGNGGGKLKNNIDEYRWNEENHSGNGEPGKAGEGGSGGSGFLGGIVPGISSSAAAGSSAGSTSPGLGWSTNEFQRLYLNSGDCFSKRKNLTRIKSNSDFVLNGVGQMLLKGNMGTNSTNNGYIIIHHKAGKKLYEE